MPRASESDPQGRHDHLVQTGRRDLEGPLDPALGARVATAEVVAPPVQQGAPRQRVDDVTERLEDAAQRLELPVPQQLRAVQEKQVRGRHDVTGREPVLDRLTVVALSGEAIRRPRVELRQALRHHLASLEPEQVTEQVVVSEPRRRPVQPDQQLVRGGGLGEPRAAAGRPRDGVHQPAVELLQHRGLQQALTVGGVEPGEELVPQVLDDQLVVTPERRQEPVRVVGLPQRQPGEDQPGRPALGATAQLRHAGLVESRSGGAEQDGRLCRVEPQVGAPQLDQLAAHPQPPQPERRVHPRRQHEGDLWWAQLDQSLDAGVHADVVDEVVVVDHDHEAVHQGGELVDQGGHDDEPVTTCARHQWGQVPRSRARQRDGPYEVGPEPRRVRVARLDLQPGHRVVAAGEPGGQQRRLAEPAGALSSTSRVPSPTPVSSRSSSRDRRTSRAGGRGRDSLVAASPDP